MSNRRKLVINHEQFTYVEVIQLAEESYIRETPPLNGGYNVALAGRSFDEWLDILNTAIEANDATLAQNTGNLECLFTGDTLYPILRIADIGVISAHRMLTIYVNEALGIALNK